MEALEAARLAAPLEIHDVPTAPIPALELQEALARSMGPRARMARGSNELEVETAPFDRWGGLEVADPYVPVVRTFPARHPWLCAAAGLAVTVLLLLALHGSA